MDIKGVKPVASREKQRPLGAKTNTHFGDRTAPVSFGGAQRMGAVAMVNRPAAAQARPTISALQPAPTVLAATSPRPQQAFTAPSQLMETPQQQPRVARKRRGRPSRRGLLLRGAAAVCMLVLTIGGLLAWNGYTKLHKVFHGTSVVAALAPKTASDGTLSGEASGRINILLLGVSGSGGTGADLTDTVALLSIDPVNDKAVLLNIPTDLWVQKVSSYYGHQELNAVYQSGRDAALGPSARPTDPGVIEAGFGSLDQVIENVTGVTINYHLLLNFQAFKQAVDAVGGVTVNSPSRLYDPSLGWRNHVSPVLAMAGTQHMDGDQALLYVRSRVMTSKSSQVLRELQVLNALQSEVLSAGTFSNPAKLEELIEGFGDNAYSDLSIKGAEQLYKLMGKVGDDGISSINLIGTSHNLLTTKHISRHAVSVPSAGLEDYAAIQQYVRGYMASGKIVKEDAPVAVMSSTGAGAAIAGDMLKSYGCNVITTEATKGRVSHLTLVDMSGGDDPATLHFLEDHYGVKAVAEVPSGVSVPSGAPKFVIIEP